MRSKALIALAVLLVGIALVVIVRAVRSHSAAPTAGGESAATEVIEPDTSAPNGVVKPELVAGAQKAENPLVKYEKIESKMEIKGDEGLRLAGETKVIIRYISKDGIMTMSPGDGVREDLVLGKAGRGEKSDRAIYTCPGKTHDGKAYTYLSTYKNCGVEGKSNSASFALGVGLKYRTQMPVALCETPKGNRYATLSAQCEKQEDRVDEFLGYIVAAKVEHK